MDHVTSDDVANRSRNPKRDRILKRVLLVSVFVAFIVVCTGIGKTQPTPIGNQVFDTAIAASSNEYGTVIADSEGTRLLFLNPSDQLVAVYGLSDLETPITGVTKIQQVGEEVFVSGIKHGEDGESIKTEAVVKFNMAGELLGTVWKTDNKDDVIQVSPSINDITYDNEGNIILVKFNKQAMHALAFESTVTKVAKGTSDEQVLRETNYLEEPFPFALCYDAQGNRCVMADIYGRLFIEQNANEKAQEASTDNRTLMVQAFDVDGDKAVMYDEYSHALVRANDLFGNIQLEDLDTGVRCNDVEICGDTAIAVLDTGAARIYSLSSGTKRELTEAPLVSSLAIRTAVLFWSNVYLAVVCVAAVVWWLIRSVKRGRHAKVRRAIIAIAVSLICMSAMVLHMLNLFGTSVTSRLNSMSQIVSQASVTSPAELGDAATNETEYALGLQGEEYDYQKDLETIVYNIEGVLTSSFGNSNGVQCTIYAANEAGEVYCLFSSHQDSVVLGMARGDDITSAVNTVIQAANKHEGSGEEKAYRYAHDDEVQTVSRRDMTGNVASCVAPLIAKDGTCCTAIEVSCHVESQLNKILDNMRVILLLFLTITASIYVVSDEVIRSGSAFLGYRKLHEQGVEWAETLLGRPLSFVLNIAFGMDAAFAVVIAKEMLAGSNLDSTAAVWGIPALAITMGTTIGTIVHAVMCSRVSGRSFALPMMLLGAASHALCFFAVMNDWFVVFVACKLISSASFATTNFIAKNLAGGTAGKDIGDEHLSLVVNRSSVNIAGKGAAVVASGIGGVLAYTGNQWVYVAEALVSVAVIPLLLLALPKGRIISQHGDRATLRNIFEFLHSPIMLVTLVFAILPTVLAGGYKSYILPLFLDSAGVSKTDIASLFALGNVILYGFTDTLITNRNARGRWVLTWVALIGLGVLFVLFSFNQAPTWAVVAVVVITVLAWLAGDWKHTARWWAKKDYGFSFDQSQAALNIEESVVKNVQAPVLTGLLTLGASTCCLVLGIFLCISGVCYYFPTRNRGDFA